MIMSNQGLFLKLHIRDLGMRIIRNNIIKINVFNKTIIDKPLNLSQWILVYAGFKIR